MNREQNDLGRRYEGYHHQTGNLYATGYALTIDEARALLEPYAQALGLSLRRVLHAVVGRLVCHQPSTKPAHGQAVVR